MAGFRECVCGSEVIRETIIRKKRGHEVRRKKGKAIGATGSIGKKGSRTT